MLVKSIYVSSKGIKKNGHIAEEFNKYFINVWINLPGKIQNTSKTFEDFFISHREEYGIEEPYL